MLTFLKKLGAGIAQGLFIASGLTPFLKTISPAAGTIATKVESELSQAANVIASIEGVGQVLNLPGPDKLKAAGPAIMQVLLNADFMAGKKIKDPTLAMQGATKVADGMADFLNSLHPDAVQTSDKTPIAQGA